MTKEKIFKKINQLRDKGFTLPEIQSELESKGMVNEKTGKVFSIATIRKAYVEKATREKKAPAFHTIPVNESMTLSSSKIIALIGPAPEILSAIREL